VFEVFHRNLEIPRLAVDLFCTSTDVQFHAQLAGTRTLLQHSVYLQHGDGNLFREIDVSAIVKYSVHKVEQVQCGKTLSRTLPASAAGCHGNQVCRVNPRVFSAWTYRVSHFSSSSARATTPVIEQA